MITLTKDRYETLGHLGSGASSRVDKARDNVIGRTVALKTFLNDFGPGLEQQFLREAQIIGQLSNPSIVQLYDVGINERGIPFLVMEYVAGKTLEDHLDPSALPLQPACAWAADLAGATHRRLREIIHGDVKPGTLSSPRKQNKTRGFHGIARHPQSSVPKFRYAGISARTFRANQDPRQSVRARRYSLHEMVCEAFAMAVARRRLAQILNASPYRPHVTIRPVQR
jgi:hypothetical protein